MKPTIARALTAFNSAPGAPEPGARDELALRFHITSATFSVAVIAIAIGALIGWFAHIPALTSVFPGFVSMKINAAIGLLLTGVALWFYRERRFSPRRDVALRYCAGLAALIGFATTLEYLTGWNLRIDELLMRDTSGGLAPAGRMALATAVCLMLLNSAILIANTPGRYAIAQTLTLTAVMLATLNGVGYFFGLETFGGLAKYSAMAVHTAICILLVATGILFARPDQGLMNAVIDVGAGGVAIRQFLPAVFVLPVLLAWISWQGVRIGWYEPSFAMTVFVALATNVLGYAVWAGGHVLRGFDAKRLSAENERMRSEERLRRAVADAPVPTIIHDVTGHILHMSRGWSHYSGLSAADTPTVQAWVAATEPQGVTPFETYLQRLSSATQTEHGGEWVIKTKAGHRIWEFSTTPVGTPGSADHALVTMAVDITERQTAEAKLRRLNEELEQRILERTAELTTANDALKRQSDQLKEQATLLDLVRDGILVRDLYGTIVYWSAGAFDMYGWTEKDALGAVSHKLLRVEYPKPVAEIEKQVMATGIWEGEVVQVTKSGVRLSVESRWTLTRTERGAPQGFLEVNRDITARKRAQESLGDSELRFRSVAETAIEGIITTDEKGVISYWNPGAERLFGRTSAEALGQPSSVVLPDRLLSSFDPRANGQVLGTTFETSGRRRNGSLFPLEISVSAWTNTQGARFFTGIARDITARKNAEQALEAKAEELARSNKELEQFAYVASHDLQEPLRMVSNYTQLLARRYKDKLDADANEFIDFATDGATRMQDLIHDLLEYARVGTRGKDFKPTSLDKVIANAMMNLSNAIDEAHAEIEIGKMPTVACDATQLTQVFQNLMGNAIKFRRPGDRPVITVSATHDERGWTIAVRDNGIGIEAKHFDRIFQMFQRLHGRGEYSGTGIGLALVKKIVERHSGTIRVESTPGVGTTFAFTLPDVTARAAEKQSA